MSDCYIDPKYSSRDKWGYVLINKKAHGYNYLHRKVYAKAHNVELQPTDIIMHTCDNPPCCNVEHLTLGSLKDNTQDMLKKKRHPCSIEPEDRKKIVDMYSTGQFTQQEIGDMFGVTQVRVGQLIRGNF